MITAFKRDALWPPIVPSVVLVECLSGRPRTDALTNRFLKTCDIVEELPLHLAVVLAYSGRWRKGSAVDAIVVASAEPGGSVLSGDVSDLRAIAAHADDVLVIRI